MSKRTTPGIQDPPAHLNLKGLAIFRGIRRLEDLATKAGVSLSSISGVSNGRVPGPSVRRALCAALDVTEAQLLAAVAHAHREVLSASR